MPAEFTDSDVEGNPGARARFRKDHRPALPGQRRQPGTPPLLLEHARQGEDFRHFGSGEVGLLEEVLHPGKRITIKLWAGRTARKIPARPGEQGFSFGTQRWRRHPVCTVPAGNPGAPSRYAAKTRRRMSSASSISATVATNGGSRRMTLLPEAGAEQAGVAEAGDHRGRIGCQLQASHEAQAARTDHRLREIRVPVRPVPQCRRAPLERDVFEQMFPLDDRRAPPVPPRRRAACRQRS